MKKSFIPLVLLTTTLLIGCGARRNKQEDKVLPNPDEIDDKENGEVTVNFYSDFNQKIAKVIYATQSWDFGDKVVEIAGPSTAPDPAFSEFAGWSAKEVVDDLSDLFDFSTVLSKENVDDSTGKYVLDLFGIWITKADKK